MQLGSKKKSSKSIYVNVEQNRVIRKVYNLKEAEVVMLVAKKNNMLGKTIVDTKILSEDENLLEHRKIKHIIHSGEYTESMAYDVTKLGIDMALDFIKYGIYSYDLLPHNYTFENGNWILYDFGALKISPEQVKTQIRSIFKISFSAFELTKIISRSKLKHYYLNRIKLYDLMQMIPLKNWLDFRRTLRAAQVLCVLGMYEKAYNVLKSYFIHYEEEFKPSVYEYSKSDREEEFFKTVDEIVKTNKLNDIFCIGELAGKWAINSNSKLSKFVYFDDYDLCDEYYNYLKTEKIKNISTAVLYPMMADGDIPEKKRYRAIYDYFAQDRFCSDCVILDFDEFVKDKYFELEKFCSNISKFTEKNIILKVSKPNNQEEFKIELSKYFKDVKIIECSDYDVVTAVKKLVKSKVPVEKKVYKNSNRMKEADLHTFKIMQIMNLEQRKYKIKLNPLEFIKQYKDKISLNSTIRFLNNYRKNKH